MAIKNLFRLCLAAVTAVCTSMGSYLPVVAQGLDLQVFQYPLSSRLSTANGTGVVHAVPDRAVLILGVKNWDKNLRTAYALNNTNSQKVVALSEKYKIEKADVQTTEIGVEATYPDRANGGYCYGPTSVKPDGFQVERKITFVLKNISQLQSLLADALEVGANQVMSINFNTSNLRKHKDEARRLAIIAAREKAEAMAKELQAKLGKVIIVKELSSSVNDIASSTNSRVNNMANMEALTGTSMSPEAEDSIALGQLHISSSVTVSFELTE